MAVIPKPDLDATENPSRQYESISTVSYGDVRKILLEKQGQSGGSNEFKVRDLEQLLASWPIELDIDIELLSQQKNYEPVDVAIQVREVNNPLIEHESREPIETTYGEKKSFSKKEIELEEYKVIRLLDSYQLTLDNLAESLSLPLERVRNIVMSLISKGYLDTPDAGLLRRLFPFIKQEKAEIRLSDDTYFVLTIKAFLRLYPLISFSKK